MELTNNFEVPVPVDEAWNVLTDIERIAPAMPGAQLKEVEGDEYRGLVKVKVGPITASYRGVARFEDLDAGAHRAVLKAEGRETRGQGNASATITATLKDAGDGRTAVSVATELNITGKVAQFGRGVLADVSGKLLDQFVANLETMILSPADPAGAADPSDSAVATEGHSPAADAQGARTTADPAAAQAERRDDVRQIHHREPEPVDLVGVAGASFAKRVLPYGGIVGALVLLYVVNLFRQRRR